MTWRFDMRSLAAAFALFVLLALLASAGSHLGWVRSFLGDVLAVVWVYLLLKTVLAARPSVLGLAAFAVGCAVESGQYIASAAHWQIPNRVLRIVLGSTADAWDVLAYALGLAVVLAGEALAKRLQGSSAEGMRPMMIAARRAM